MPAAVSQAGDAALSSSETGFKQEDSLQEVSVSTTNSTLSLVFLILLTQHRLDNYQRDSRQRGQRSISPSLARRRPSTPSSSLCYFYRRFGNRSRSCQPPYSKMIPPGHECGNRPESTVWLRVSLCGLQYRPTPPSGHGMQFSVLSKHSGDVETVSSFSLRAVNGTRIKTYGNDSLKLDFGLRRPYMWCLMKDDSFLQNYSLRIDLNHLEVCDLITLLCINGQEIIISSLGLAAEQSKCMFLKLLKEYPSLTNINGSLEHGVVYHIETIGPSVFSFSVSSARWAAHCQRGGFVQMFTLGIIRPSKSS